jgi:riboflavin transporter FmnP
MQTDWLGYVILALFGVLLVVAYKVYSRFFPKAEYNRTRFVARVAVFSAIATILYVVPVFQVQLPIFPPFLSLHFDEVPAFICGFAYGPLAGVTVILIKTIIKLPFTSTMGVGELCDLLYSIAFVLPAAIIYKKIRNLKGVAIAFSVSTVLQLLVSVILNIYVIYPFYMWLFGLSEEALLSIVQMANPAVTDLAWSCALYITLPMNAIKDAIVIAVTFIVYHSIHKALRF